MTRRRAGSGVAVVLAAGMLAAAASASTYGIAGDTGRHPVVFTNRGPGPAAVLRNRPAYPPVVVRSATKGVHLNADLVDGAPAVDLGPMRPRAAATRRGPLP